MMTACLAIALSSTSVSHDDVKTALRHAFTRVGLIAPIEDQRLSAAARAIAQDALLHGTDAAAETLKIAQAISNSKSADANPRAILLRGAQGSLLNALNKHDFFADRVTHVGFSVVEENDRAALTLLLVSRQFEIDPFPRAIPRASATKTYPLCGKTIGRFSSLQVYVTRPSGQVETFQMTPEARSLCAGLKFPSAGRHTVEVMGTGALGPQMLSLFFVDVENVSGDDGTEKTAEPTSTADARRKIIAHVNALRRSMRVEPVSNDTALDAIADAWARRLADEGFFSHESPDGSTLPLRLKRANYAFSSAAENLGLASGPMAAHFGIAHSPGHRKNLIDPTFTRIGIGVAKHDNERFIVVEVLARPETK